MNLRTACDGDAAAKPDSDARLDPPIAPQLSESAQVAPRLPLAVSLPDARQSVNPCGPHH